MAGFAWWKVPREARRIGRKTMRWPGEVARLFYFRRWYDLVTARAIVRTEGDLPLGAEIGIYLVFPRNGLLASHRSAIALMREAGVSPVVVSNLPLSAGDRDLLRREVARIIERPNVGYDFGGFRDAILDIADVLPGRDWLWLLNDSAWMVPQKTSWFEDARALGRDFVAATSNYAMPRVNQTDFRSIDWHHSTAHRNFHYASYALGFGRRILADPAFLRFWRRLQISNDKTRTVRRGEIGLSQWVLRRGYSHGATFEVDALDRQLAALDDDAIDRLAHDLVISDDPRLEAVREAVLRSGPAEGRADRIALILTTVSRQASGYALPAWSLPRGFQFLKKSPLWLSPQAAAATFRVIARLDGEAGRVITEEARELTRRAAID